MPDAATSCVSCTRLNRDCQFDSLSQGPSSLKRTGSLSKKPIALDQSSISGTSSTYAVSLCQSTSKSSGRNNQRRIWMNEAKDLGLEGERMASYDHAPHRPKQEAPTGAQWRYNYGALPPGSAVQTPWKPAFSAYEPDVYHQTALVLVLSSFRGSLLFHKERLCVGSKIYFCFGPDALISPHCCSSWTRKQCALRLSSFRATGGTPSRSPYPPLLWHQYRRRSYRRQLLQMLSRSFTTMLSCTTTIEIPHLGLGRQQHPQLPFRHRFLTTRSSMVDHITHSCLVDTSYQTTRKNKLDWTCNMILCSLPRETSSCMHLFTAYPESWNSEQAQVNGCSALPIYSQKLRSLVSTSVRFSPPGCLLMHVSMWTMLKPTGHTEKVLMSYTVRACSLEALPTK